VPCRDRWQRDNLNAKLVGGRVEGGGGLERGLDEGPALVIDTGVVRTNQLDEIALDLKRDQSGELLHWTYGLQASCGPSTPGAVDAAS
jgi:hypothetical protein